MAKKVELKVGGGVYVLDSLEKTIADKDYDPVMRDSIGKVFTIKDLVQGEEGLEIYVEEKPFFFIEKDVTTEGIDKLLAERRKATENIKITDLEKPKKEGQVRTESLPDVYDYFSQKYIPKKEKIKVRINSNDLARIVFD